MLKEQQGGQQREALVGLEQRAVEDGGSQRSHHKALQIMVRRILLKCDQKQL